MTDFAYAPGGALDTKGTAAVVAHRLAILDVISLSADDLAATVTATPGTHDTHPVRYVGAAPSPTHVQTSVVEDGIQGDDYWQTTRVFSNAPLSSDEVAARDTARLANVAAQRQAADDTAIKAAVAKVADANTRAALELIIKRMGVT